VNLQFFQAIFKQIGLLEFLGFRRRRINSFCYTKALHWIHV